MRDNAWNYLIFLLILIGVSIVGYAVFLAFAKNISAANLMPLIIVAIFAGFATFFSPCSFALLPAYLSLYKSKNKKDTFKNGIFASAGVITFNIILGIIIAFAGLGIGSALSIASQGQLAGVTLTIRVIIGGILFSLGILQFFHISVQGKIFHGLLKKFAKIKSRHLGFYFYGFGYNLGNTGCTGPIMAGLIVLALASGFGAALFAFVVYSLTMGLLMLAVSAIASSAKIGFMQEASHKIMRISALILMLAGIFVIATVIYAGQFSILFFP